MHIFGNIFRKILWICWFTNNRIIFYRYDGPYIRRCTPTTPNKPTFQLSNRPTKSLLTRPRQGILNTRTNKDQTVLPVSWVRHLQPTVHDSDTPLQISFQSCESKESPESVALFPSGGCRSRWKHLNDVCIACHVWTENLRLKSTAFTARSWPNSMTSSRPQIVNQRAIKLLKDFARLCTLSIMRKRCARGPTHWKNLRTNIYPRIHLNVQVRHLHSILLQEGSHALTIFIKQWFIFETRLIVCAGTILW